MTELLQSQSRELKTCDLCGKAAPFTQTTIHRFTPDSVLVKIGVQTAQRTVLCHRCGWMFKPLVLTPEQNTKLYSSIGGTNTYEASNHVHTKLRAARIFERIALYCGGISNKIRVLDVGGGVGQASLLFAENAHEVDLLDFSPGMTLHPKMVVQTCSLMEFVAENSYNVALLAHVLEHVPSPTAALTKIHDLLVPAGVIYIEVPFELYTPLVLRKTGDVAHVGYFTRNTLGRFLAKAGFGDAVIGFRLENYGARKVVVICALARKRGRTRETHTAHQNAVAFFHLIRDLLSPTQILYTLAAQFHTRYFLRPL